MYLYYFKCTFKLINNPHYTQKILKCVEDKADMKEAEILASANLALLTEMAGSKTHGFSTWALNPTIFDLVTSVRAVFLLFIVVQAH